MQSLYRRSETDTAFTTIDVYGLDEYGDLNNRKYSSPVLETQSVADIASASEIEFVTPEMFEPGDSLVYLQAQERVTLTRQDRDMHIVGRTAHRRFVVSRSLGEITTLVAIEAVLLNPRKLLPPQVRSMLSLLPAEDVDSIGFRQLRIAVESL